MPNETRRPGIRLWALALAIAALTVAHHGWAAAPDMTKTVTCQQNGPPGTVYGSIAIVLERFTIPADWDDGGPHYEVKSSLGFQAHLGDPTGTPACAGHVDWGLREYAKYNAWSGDRWAYRLDLKLVVHNVPVAGVLELSVSMLEDDEPFATYDMLDLNRYPGLTGLKLRIYPAKGRGYFLPPSGVEIDDPSHLLEFSRSKRFVGDGSGWKGGEQVVIAGLDLTVDTAQPSPIGGVAEAVTLPKVGGAVSCENYAATAVGLNATAKARGCGFKPPEWSDRYQDHLAWCKHGNNVAQAAGANARRRQELEACKSQGIVAVPPQSSEQACRDYALRAVELNQEALALKCGFGPPVWSNAHQAHFDWCQQMYATGQQGAVSAGAATRGQMLAQCKAGS